ncbi:sensor histidine kinase [Virgisporangium ochraceum]|uniref:histidine kinase n=1 Tax=Virgisporangium ochraceum TaxID=65505 RepID=A0A8J4EG33_9ACTN|nr:histidine kinase [Virgisporangium ochraceum]GIJ73346.1 histidine kinase [Virgisporangium ochraceum]
MRRLVGFGRGWVHLLLGGALLMPYFLLAETVTKAVTGAPVRSIAVQVALLAAVLPAVAVTALAGPVRLLMGVAARELLGADTAAAPARSVDDRLRTSAWSVVHLGLGGVVSALTLTLPPVVALFATMPVYGHRLGSHELPTGWAAAWGPVAALAVLGGLVAVVVAARALLTRLAGALLGPSAADRLAALRQQVQEQAVRARLARDLHDSLGHALSVISVQAGAGERRLDADPEFARAAFAAVQAAAYTASEELDRAIGVLNAGTATTAREPDLGDLDGLLGAVRDAGLEVDSRVELRPVPAAVSREIYRVVQEGLTNAVRHGGRAPVRLRLRVTADDLAVELANRVDGEAPRRPGRGLRGMTDRVAALGGEVRAGAADGEWRVRVHVPLPLTGPAA